MADSDPGDEQRECKENRGGHEADGQEEGTLASRCCDGDSGDLQGLSDSEIAGLHALWELAAAKAKLKEIRALFHNFSYRVPNGSWSSSPFFLLNVLFYSFQFVLKFVGTASCIAFFFKKQRPFTTVLFEPL